MQFIIVLKKQRSANRYEQTAQGAAGSDAQIKSSEMFRLGSKPIKLAMAHHATDEQTSGVDGHLPINGKIRALKQCPANGTEGSNQRERKRQTAVPPRAVETNYEAEQ